MTGNWTEQGRTGTGKALRKHISGTLDNELAQDCKLKENK